MCGRGLVLSLWMTVLRFCGCHVFTSLAKYRQAIGKLFTVSRQLALLVVCNIANYLLWLIRWQWGWSLPRIASFQKWNRVRRVEQWSLLTANRKLLMNTTTVVLRPFVRDYRGEPETEETFTHPPSWSSSNIYQLLPSTRIHSILPVWIACLAIFLDNLSTSTSWSGALHLIFNTFLHPVSVFFLQHMPIPSQNCLWTSWYICRVP